MKLPPWSGYNSLIFAEREEAGKSILLNFALIPGPASNYSAIYTGLVLAQNISLWVSGNGAKTIIALDLDLYEKVYLLIRSRTDLAEMFIVR